VAIGSRLPDPIGWIWNTHRFFDSAALLRWQKLRQGRKKKPGISVNKAVFPFFWKLVVLVLVRGAKRSLVRVFSKLSRWKRGEDCESGEASFNKRFVLHHRYLLCLSPLARGRSLGFDGESFSSLRCWRICATLVCLLAILCDFSPSSKAGIREKVEIAAGERGWHRSSGTTTWSLSSAIFDGLPKSFALSRPFLPVRSSGDDATSFVRPLSRSVAEGFARTKTSGHVPVGVHGCSVPSSLLHDGEEGGLDCVFPSFSKVLLTNARDPCVILLSYGILCNNLYLHH
jgi:hypothetical protein